MRTEQRGFDIAVKRATSSHHKVAMECIVQCPVPPEFLDGHYGTAASAARERGARARGERVHGVRYENNGNAPLRSRVLYVSLPRENAER
jgi:hypothetical protein